MNIQLRTISEEFLNKLNEDINKIRSLDKMFVSADKTRNYYEITEQNYNKILHDNITKTYKKTQPSLPKNINMKAKKITESFNIDNKIDIMVKRQCFVTFKDHKDDFRVNPKYRLLYPTKSELGKLSKDILQQISTNMRTALNVNRWQNSSVVIKQFKNIKNKNLHTFTVFNIEKSYPSIGEKLFYWHKRSFIRTNSQTHTEINRKDIEVIFHYRISLFHDNKPWIKNAFETFDVTVGNYDGKEVCELAGLFMLTL